MLIWANERFIIYTFTKKPLIGIRSFFILLGTEIINDLKSSYSQNVLKFKDLCILNTFQDYARINRDITLNCSKMFFNFFKNIYIIWSYLVLF